VTEPERLQAENRRLRAESVKAREDLALCQERLAYVLVELTELRKKIPTTQIQAAAPVSGS